MSMTSVESGMAREIAAQCLGDDRLHLIVLPTEQCNFRCTYCYEDFVAGKMTAELVLGLQRLISRRFPTLRHLEISWFGGEPLLALDVMVAVQQHVVELKEQWPDVEISSSATTNGYLLTAATAERLCSLNVRRYQVSLDGPQAAHDAQRPLRGGRGTFAVIWSNLLDLANSDLDFSVLIRVNLTAASAPAVEEWLVELKRFTGDSRFSVVFEHVRAWGGPNDSSIERLSNPLDTVAAFEASLGSRDPAEDGTPDVCYAAHGNSFVVRSDGRLGKCTVALNDERNVIGQLLPSGAVDVSVAALAPWLEGLATLDPDAMRCPMRAMGSSGASRSGPVSINITPRRN